MMRSRTWWALAAVVVAIISYFEFTVFVIQPIGAIPDGVTMVLWRHSAALGFVDSADAFCARQQGGVSLLCRAMVLAEVVKINPIIVRFPYSHGLYLLSTGGKDYDR